MLKYGSCVGKLALIFGAALTCASAATMFFQTNLTSDIPGLAANTDPQMKNPWGSSFGPTTPFWISNQVSNVSNLYNGAGAKLGLSVSTPPSPTGQVFNSSPSFLLSNGSKALFIFDTLSGNIAAWNQALGTSGTVPAQVVFTATDGAVFTGLALGNNGASDLLYAADFRNAKIDVFNSSFAPTTVSGGFTDPNLPAGYSPYNIQTVAGNLYVEYDKVDPTTHRPTTTPNTGIVDVFNMNGTLVQRLATDTHLNSPWGVTQAPPGFGTFGGDILVGNFGDGTISAFDGTGNFVGTLSNQAGNPIVNSGLWALNFRASGSGFDPNALFINAGINNEADGLFAEIQVVPEPSSFAMLAVGLGFAALGRRKRRA